MLKDLHIVDQCRCKIHSKKSSDQEEAGEPPKGIEIEKSDDTKTSAVYKPVPRPWHKSSKEQQTKSSSSTEPPRKIEMKKTREVNLKPNQLKVKVKPRPTQMKGLDEEDQQKSKGEGDVILIPKDIDSEEGRWSEDEKIVPIYVSRTGKQITKEEWERRKKIQDDYEELMKLEKQEEAEAKRARKEKIDYEEEPFWRERSDKHREERKEIKSKKNERKREKEARVKVIRIKPTRVKTSEDRKIEGGEGRTLAEAEEETPDPCADWFEQENHQEDQEVDNDDSEKK